MFRGNQPTRVDDKGRLKVPSDYKRLLDEQGDTQFFITSKDGERAEIYPLREWVKVEEGLAKIASMSPAKRKFLDVTNYYGQVVEFDSQGRLLMPQVLRSKAKLEGDVAVLGQGNILVVVEDRRIREELEQNGLTEAEQAELAALGL